MLKGCRFGENQSMNNPSMSNNSYLGKKYFSFIHLFLTVAPKLSVVHAGQYEREYIYNNIFLMFIFVYYFLNLQGIIGYKKNYHIIFEHNPNSDIAQVGYSFSFYLLLYSFEEVMIILSQKLEIEENSFRSIFFCID